MKTATSAKVYVTCPKCRGSIPTTYDALREAADADRPIPCRRCEAKRGPKPKQGQRTAAEVIALAAGELGSAVFDLSDLIITAWELDPGRFGLHGHEQNYPDSNRVSCEVSKMLRLSKERAPWLVNVGPRRYRLTPAGEVRAAALAKQGGSGPPRR